MQQNHNEISADDDVAAHSLTRNINEESLEDDEPTERQRLATNTNEARRNNLERILPSLLEKCNR